MTDLEEAQLQHKLASDAVMAQLATIETVESRLAQIDGDLQRFNVELGEAAFTNNLNIDWAQQAAYRLGLELEKSTLPAVIIRLKEPLSALQAAAQRATREIERLMKENADDGKVEKIREMLDAGKTNRLIQAESGLTEHDFYRLLAVAKRPTMAGTQPV
jgi:hypothetical protein